MARLLIIFLCFLYLSCGSSGGKRYSATNLKVTTRYLHGDNTAALKVTDQEAPAVRQVVYDLIAAIIEYRKSDIVALVHPEKGALTDVKSPRTQKQIEQDLADRNSVIYKTFFSGQSGEESFASLFARSSEIQLDLFFYSAQEVEVRLLFPERPPSGVLGNLILHKIDNRWYVAQFF